MAEVMNVMAPDDVQRTIERRARVIAVFKQELIRRLNLPYTPEDLHEDVSLLGSGLGLDSLDALEIVLCIESCFQIKIPDENVAVLRSINTVVDFVIQEQDRKGASCHCPESVPALLERGSSDPQRHTSSRRPADCGSEEPRSGGSAKMRPEQKGVAP